MSFTYNVSSSARKNAIELKEALESVVVPMFCNAHINATDEQRLKLEKLLKLWESKANYLDKNTVEQMRQPLQSYQQYQANQMMKYSAEISSLAQQTKATYDSYEAQHQAFVCHALQQISELQQQKQTFEQQAAAPPMASSNIIPLETIQASLQQTIQNLSQQNTTNNNNNTQNPPPNQNFNFDTINPPPLNQPTNEFIPMDPSIPPPNMTAPPPIGQSPDSPNLSSLPSNGLENRFALPPPGFFPPPAAVFPDFSKPPPGFNPEPPPMEDLIPTVPYYDLPAGLIVPLIKV